MVSPLYVIPLTFVCPCVEHFQSPNMKQFLLFQPIWTLIFRIRNGLANFPEQFLDTMNVRHGSCSTQWCNFNVGAIISCETSSKILSFYVEKLSASHTIPKMKHELPSFSIFEITFWASSSSQIPETRQSVVVRDSLNMADWEDHRYGGPQPVYREALNTKMSIFKLKVKM